MSQSDGMIGTLATVNCGTLIDYPNFTVEAMGKGYSSHRINIVAVYASEGITKVSVVYDGASVTVYRFRTHSDTKHYWSRNYTVEAMEDSVKYGEMVKALKFAYSDIFKK